MKPFEIAYLLLEPFNQPVYRIIRRQLVEFVRASQDIPRILDVGGRKSPYTIGVPAKITITDLLRETVIQESLNLGITQNIVEQIYSRRSNVERILIDDLTRSTLPNAFFDCVVAIEVLEHVREDMLFVNQVHRVLKPGGIFLMTTPNADHPGRQQGIIPPGNERFYTRELLNQLLSSCFATVEVIYGSPVGKLFSLGLRPWSIRHPWQTIITMRANFIQYFRAVNPAVKVQSQGTRHLIATATK